MRQGINNANLPLHAWSQPKCSQQKWMQKKEGGWQRRGPWMQRVGPSMCLVPGSIPGLIPSRWWCWRLCWEGQAEERLGWRGWAQSPVLLEHRGWGSFVCNSGFCFWHRLEAGRRSCVATLNENRLGINFKSIFLLFCLNKKLTGDAWAAVNDKDAGKWPHGCGYVCSTADKAGLYT